MFREEKVTDVYSFDQEKKHEKSIMSARQLINSIIEVAIEVLLPNDSNKLSASRVTLLYPVPSIRR